MSKGRIIFAQLMSYLPREKFNACVAKYKGDRYCKNFSCADHYRTMAFSQITPREGLRGIQDTLNANAHCLYHMGFRCKAIARSTLARANENRSWKIYAEFALDLMRRTQKLYCNEPLGVELDADVFAVDSTTIDLCLAKFPWAPSQKSKAAIKLHVALDLHGNIPDFIVISDARTVDLAIFDTLRISAGAYYIFDRGYFSFKHLYLLNTSKAYFVIRPLKNVAFTIEESYPVMEGTGVECDQLIRATGEHGKRRYPDFLRRIEYRDKETGNFLVFFTNDFSLPAVTIAELYKQRWQVELFFKWLKQHLKIKAFYGNSENAVRTQLWIAISVYCLLAIIKKDLNGNRELHEVQEILSASIFQKMPILQVFSRGSHMPKIMKSCNQLKLF